MMARSEPVLITPPYTVPVVTKTLPPSTRMRRARKLPSAFTAGANELFVKMLTNGTVPAGRVFVRFAASFTVIEILSPGDAVIDPVNAPPEPIVAVDVAAVVVLVMVMFVAAGLTAFDVPLSFASVVPSLTIETRDVCTDGASPTPSMT